MNSKEKFYDKKVGQKLPKQQKILGYLWEKLRTFEKHRHDVCLELLPASSKKLLDVGCNGGVVIIKALQNIRGKAYGIDISNRAVKLAKINIQKSGFGTRASFKKADIDEKIPFPRHSFDAVICIAVLEHVFDPLFVMSEFKRVIKPRGTLIVEVPNLAFFPRRLVLLIGKRPRTSWGYGWDGGHLQYFTMGDLCSLFEANGFRPTVKTGSGIFNGIRKVWPSLLHANLIVAGTKK